MAMCVIIVYQYNMANDNTIDRPIKEPMTEYKFEDENKKHLHTFTGKPLLGASTVCGVIAKNLTWWAAEMAAVECLEVGEKIPTIREEYLAACAAPDKKIAIDGLQKKYPIFKAARFAHFKRKNEAAKDGTDLHAELENFVKAFQYGSPILPEFFDPKIRNFILWFIENVDKVLWSELHGYSTTMWVGGISDCAVKLKDGKVGIIDFKSAKEAYDSMFVQCAGYDLLISENGGFNASGYPIFKLHQPIDFYAIVPFGAPEFTIDFRYDVEAYREGFKAAVVLYKLTNQ